MIFLKTSGKSNDLSLKEGLAVWRSLEGKIGINFINWIELIRYIIWMGNTLCNEDTAQRGGSLTDPNYVPRD